MNSYSSNNMLINTDIYTLCPFFNNGDALNPDINNDGVFNCIDDKLLSEYCDGLNLSELDSWINFTYEYNDQNQLISVDGNTVGEFTDIAIINLTMEYIYDLDSNLTNVDNMIEYTWYSDYQGGYVTTTNLNTISCEYNNGNLVEQTLKTGGSLNNLAFDDSTTFYSTFNNNNQLIEYSQNSNGEPGNIDWTITFNYNEDGNLTSLESSPLGNNDPDNYFHELVYDNNNMVGIHNMIYHLGPTGPEGKGSGWVFIYSYNNLNNVIGAYQNYCSGIDSWCPTSECNPHRSREWYSEPLIISIDEHNNMEELNKSLITTIDILGRKTTNKGFQLHIYDDGSVEIKYLIK